MSFVPPTRIISTYNPTYWPTTSTGLTLSAADSLFLHKSGDTITGSLISTVSTPSTSSITGAIQCAGGIYVGNNSLLAGKLTMSNTTASTSNTTGSLLLSGGIGISKTTDAASITNGGTFTTAGGMAVAKTLYAGTGLNVGSTTLGASSSLVNMQSSSYQLNLLNTSTYYTRLGTDASGNLLLETNTAGGSGGVITNYLSPSNSGSLGLGISPRGTARLDFGATAGNAIVKLYQANSSSSTYMIGANGAAIQYTSGGATGHQFNIYTGTTPETIGTACVNIAVAATTIQSGNLLIPTGRVQMTNSGYGFSHFNAASPTTELNTISDGTQCGIGSFTNTPLNIYTNNANRIWITAAGIIGIGTTTPSSGAVHINGSQTNSFAGAYGYLGGLGAGTSVNTGNVQCSLRCSDRIFAVEIDCNSDRRLKEDIRPIMEEEALALLSVDPVHFKWKRTGERSYGYIAQDVLKAGPLTDKEGRYIAHPGTCGSPHLLADLSVQVENDEMVEEVDDDGFVSPAGHNFLISYQKCVPLLHKMIQMQQNQIDQNKAEIDTLKQLLQGVPLEGCSVGMGRTTKLSRNPTGSHIVALLPQDKEEAKPVVRRKKIIKVLRD